MILPMVDSKNMFIKCSSVVQSNLISFFPCLYLQAKPMKSDMEHVNWTNLA